MTNTLYKQRNELFPVTTREIHERGQTQLAIADSSLLHLALKYGTPLYVYDRTSLDQAAQAYRQALDRYYPTESAITYAGKAFLCLAICNWLNGQDLWLDCSGESELEIGTKAGIPRKRLLLHGVSKTPGVLLAGLQRAGTIVIDNLDELDLLLNLLGKVSGDLPDFWLRLRPGVAVETHSYTQTGQELSKFGMGFAEFELAVKKLLERGISPKGIHFHLGSHFHDPSPIANALDVSLDLVEHLKRSLGWIPKVFCPGGGWGVPYHESDLPHRSVGEYVEFVAEKLLAGCQSREIPLPCLQLEPGRSLIARAGVAIYQVQAVKHTRNRRWLLVDGGLADNPRPALYRARYSALPVVNPDRPSAGPAWIGGAYCESGDILIEELPLPEVSPGDLLAIPVSGAYQLSMSSNYNGACRPSVVWLEEGGNEWLIRRRETLDDLLLRDFPLPARKSI